MKKLLLLFVFLIGVVCFGAPIKNNEGYIEIFSIDGPPQQIFTVLTYLDKNGVELKRGFLLSNSPEEKGEIYNQMDSQETIDFINTLKNKEPISTFENILIDTNE